VASRGVTSFVLIPGAGGDPWNWHRVAPILERAGHEAIVVGLPGPDESAGLSDYARIVIEMIDHRKDVVVVAHSLGGFTAPLVTQAVAVRELVLVNPMIPIPGETPGDWWDNTGATVARQRAAEQAGYSVGIDPHVYFLHDVPEEVLTSSDHEPFEESSAVFGCRCEFVSWPDVETRVVVGADDRFFPAEFQRTVARDRLGVEINLVAGGHLLALSQPDELSNVLLKR
jgi:pimeloyl-ACP methyl ester carboxylesterase